MTWVKVDVRFPDHSKTLDIGPLAEALWLRGLCYAGRQLSDGFIPTSYVRRMGDLDGMAEAVRLVDAGLWEQEEGGWRIHDYLEWQRSKIEAEALSAKRAEAGRIGGKQKASNLPSKTLANGKQTPSKTLAEKRRGEEIREEQEQSGEFRPTYVETLGDKYPPIRRKFTSLSPEFNDGMFRSLLAETEQEAGPATTEVLVEGLHQLLLALERQFKSERSGGKTVGNLKPYARSILVGKLQEVHAS